MNTATLFDAQNFLDHICCGLCLINFPTVDVSYFPVPGADYSCVDSTVDHSPANATHPSVVTTNGIIFDGTPFSIGTVPVQLPPQFNPWDTSSAASGTSHVVTARGHPLLGDGSHSNVVGPDGFTYTYPSIYVAFHDVSATDKCGQFGQVHTSVTLAFDPGELSTVEGPFNFVAQTTKSFNLADLPCPPRSVLSADWYTLGPGQPYRPRLALPKKLQGLDPAWSSCSGYQAEGIDPPKALGAVSAMDPGTTLVDPAPVQTPATPSKAIDPLPAITSPAVAPKPPPGNNDPPKDPPAPVTADPNPSPQPSKSADPSTAPKKIEPPKPLKSVESVDPSQPWKGADPPQAPKAADPPQPWKGADPPQDPKGANPPPPAAPAAHTDPIGAIPAAVHTAAPNDPAQNPNLQSSNPIVHPNPDPQNQQQNKDPNPNPNQNANPNPNPNPQPQQDPKPQQGQTTNQNPGPQSPNPNPQIQQDPGSHPQNPNAGAAPSVPNAPMVVVQGQTLSENGPAITVGGAAVAYSSGFIQVGSSVAPVITPPPQPGPQQPPPQVVGGLTFSRVQQSQVAVPLPVTVGGLPVSVANSAVFIGSITVAPGSAITISGTPISLGPSGLHVGSDIIPLPTAVAAPIATIGGHVMTAAASGNGYVIDKTTLIPGGPAMTVSGTPISLGAAGLVVGSSTIPLPASSVYTVGGQSFTAHATGFVVAGTSMTPGGPPVTISGTTVSLGSSGNLVIGTNTFTLPSSPGSPVFTVGGQTFTANPTAMAIAGTSIVRGGPGITISGTPISLGASGLVIGTSTISLPSATNAVFTVGGQIFTASPTGFNIAGTSVLPGGPAITISGTPVSLGPSGLVIGTSTIPLTSTPTNAVFTIAGQTFTANPTGFAIAGTTLRPGGPGITVSGTPVSLGASGLVVGTSTIPLATTSVGGGGGGFGGAILSGLGPIGPSSTGGSVQSFEGGQGKVGVEWLVLVLGVFVGGWGLVLGL